MAEIFGGWLHFREVTNHDARLMRADGMRTVSIG